MSSYENELLLKEFKGQIEGSASMFVFKYAALTPDKVWNLRSELAKNKSTLEVVRRRVFQQAAKESGIISDAPITGNICADFVNQSEPMDALKAVFGFKSENAESNIEALYGEHDGKLMTGSQVEYLSKLPNLDGMRAQIIGLFVAPMAQVLSVMEAKIEASTADQNTQTE
jgi:large subunit ribosomal protein L10